MKIISLNTWGGRAGKEGLLAFFDRYKDDVDIFCLQEIWSAPYENQKGLIAGGRSVERDEIMVHGMQEISELLSDHSKYFRPSHQDNYGLMMLVNSKLNVEEEGEIFVHKHKGYLLDGDVGYHARNLQYVRTAVNNRPVTVMNFHGLWNGKGKTDSEDRLNQSKNITEFTKNAGGDIVLCGDFNLLPDTESVKIIEDAGFRSLIKEFGITSTRTSHYTKPEKFADYAFVSGGINVKEFKVLPDEVSDHSPLYIEIE